MQTMLSSFGTPGPMKPLLPDFHAQASELSEALDEVMRAHHEALFRLALAAEIRDHDTGAHIVRMGFLAEHLALVTGMPEADAAMLRKAAPMHDVGKIGIPDSVLKKAGVLSAEERAIMNEHPAIAARILGSSRIPLFQLAAEAALAHHERWDGLGYPSNLAGKEIPLSGRIVALVDFFDAVTMDRCYRAAFSDEEALAMLRAERGRAFCPDLVDAFIAHAPCIIALRDHINRVNPSFADLVAGVSMK